MGAERPDLSIIRPSRYSGAVIKTPRGDIKNFVRLADKGFYKGLTFHRIVPNFVIQGGDQTVRVGGSGIYPMRRSAEAFTTGTLEWYSGKYGGSQFFIRRVAAA